MIFNSHQNELNKCEYDCQKPIIVFDSQNFNYYCKCCNRVQFKYTCINQGLEGTKFDSEDNNNSLNNTRVEFMSKLPHRLVPQDQDEDLSLNDKQNNILKFEKQMKYILRKLKHIEIMDIMRQFQTQCLKFSNNDIQQLTDKALKYIAVSTISKYFIEISCSSKSQIFSRLYKKFHCVEKDAINFFKRNQMFPYGLQNTEKKIGDKSELLKKCEDMGSLLKINRKQYNVLTQAYNFVRENGLSAGGESYNTIASGIVLLASQSTQFSYSIQQIIEVSKVKKSTLNSFKAKYLINSKKGIDNISEFLCQIHN